MSLAGRMERIIWPAFGKSKAPRGQKSGRSTSGSMTWSSRVNGKLVGDVIRGLDTQGKESTASFSGGRNVSLNRLRMPKDTWWFVRQGEPDA